jgi:glycine cleavage system H protein
MWNCQKLALNADAGKECAVVESVKAAGDIYAPVSGEVVGVNEALADAPESVNTDAFGAWLFKLKPANAADVDALLSADAYAKNIG